MYGHVSSFCAPSGILGGNRDSPRHLRSIRTNSCFPNGTESISMMFVQEIVNAAVRCADSVAPLNSSFRAGEPDSLDAWRAREFMDTFWLGVGGEQIPRRISNLIFHLSVNPHSQQVAISGLRWPGNPQWSGPLASPPVAPIGASQRCRAFLLASRRSHRSHSVAIAASRSFPRSSRTPHSGRAAIMQLAVGNDVLRPAP